MAKRKSRIYQIGVMASETNVISKDLRERVYIVGESIAKRGHVLITGGGTKGIPFLVTKSAKLNGGKVMAISPGFSPMAFRDRLRGSKTMFDAVIQTGLSSSKIEKNSIGSDYLNILSSDGVIFIGGNSGTLAEFIIALRSKKVIGILTNSAGLSNLYDKISKNEAKHHVLRHSNPKILVQNVLVLLDRLRKH